METKDSDSMMDHYFDKLLQIARFDPEVVKNEFLCKEAERRVEPLVKICLEWGKSGVVPEKLIMSYDDKSKKGKKEEKKVEEKNTKENKENGKVQVLKKQIQRKQLAKGLKILQRRMKIK